MLIARLVTLVLLVLISNRTLGQQNLVPNGSFEVFDTCPNAISNVYTDYQVRHCADWYTPTIGSSDYLNSCAPLTTGISVPSNFAGWQIPFEGNAYCGLYAYGQTNNGEYKEYIQAKLVQPLIAGYKYSLTFYVAHSNDLAAQSDYAVAGIGAVFTENPVSRNDWKNVPLIPQVANAAGSYITDTVNWTKISGEFVAAGNEQYITIGNFNDSLSGDTLRLWNQVPQGYLAYYFVDSITLTMTSSSPYLINLITPNGDSINDIIDFSIYSLSEIELEIFNRWGNRVYFSNQSRWNGSSDTGEPLSTGVYYYLLKGTSADQRTIRYKGFIHLFQNP